MSNTTPIIEAPAASDCVELFDAEGMAAPSLERSSRAQRGMVTIEYAIGAVLVVVIVGMVLAALHANTAVFNELVKTFTTFVMDFTKTVKK